jgi:hypothetical protein
VQRLIESRHLQWTSAEHALPSRKRQVQVYIARAGGYRADELLKRCLLQARPKEFSHHFLFFKDDERATGQRRAVRANGGCDFLLRSRGCLN